MRFALAVVGNLEVGENKTCSEKKWKSLASFFLVKSNSYYFRINVGATEVTGTNPIIKRTGEEKLTWNMS